jgi:hypothetical protein
MFFRKSIFENFKIFKNKIISFEAAKVLPIVLNFWHVRGAWGLGEHLGELAWMPTIQKNIFPLD